MTASFPISKKTFTQVTDFIDDAEAININPVYDEVQAIEQWLKLTLAIGHNSNTATLTTDLNLSDTDDPIQFIDPSTDSWKITLPTASTDNHIFYIRNSSADAIDLPVYSGTDILGTITPLTIATFLSDGLIWDNICDGGREILSSAGAYHVNVATGNDSYSGLTSGTPFKTIQHLIDVVGGLDPKIYPAVGIVAPGTYDEPLTLESMNLIRSFEIRGDTRLMAGLAYVDGKGARMPLASTGNNGGAGTVSFSRGGAGNTELTVTCATTAVDFDADGWGAGDKVIVYDGTTPNNVTEVTLASAANNVLTATTAWPDPAGATSGAGYSIVLKPNVIINPTTDTTSYVFTMINTRNVTLTGLHFQGSSTRNIMYIKDFCKLTLQGVSLQGGSSYHINCMGNSIVTNQGATLWKAFTSIDSTYGVSGQQEGQLRLQYATVIKGTTWGFSAQVNSCGATYGYNLAVKCGTAFYATLMSSISAYYSESIGATVDDFDPNVNTSGNGNSYIRQ
jgi:hypothetical protein